MRVRLRGLENIPLQKLKIAWKLLFILQMPEQVKNYPILRKFTQQIRIQLLCNNSSECLYLLKWVWTLVFFFWVGGESLNIITILQTGETEAQKDEVTCPRSSKKPAGSKTESLKIQSWVLGLIVPWEQIWLPVTSTKALCQAENQPQANMQTSAPTNNLRNPAVDLPLPYMERHEPVCLPFGVNAEKSDTRISSWRSQILNRASSTH